MEIKKETYETIKYKANDVKEVLLVLIEETLPEEKQEALKEDLMKQLDEIKSILKSL